MASEIGLDELLAEYKRLGLTHEDEGLTSKELGKRWGLADDAVRVRLHIAQAAGLLRVGRKMAKRLDGQPTIVPCYTIEIPKAKRKK